MRFGRPRSVISASRCRPSDRKADDLSSSGPEKLQRRRDEGGPGCGHVVDEQDPSGLRASIGRAKGVPCDGKPLASGQLRLRRRVPGADKCSSHRRAYAGREVHGQKLALVETPLPEPHRMERDRHNDVRRRPGGAQHSGSSHTSKVARDRGPALILERVYHGAGCSLELQGVEHAGRGARALSWTGRSGQIERPRRLRQGQRPGPGAQSGSARSA